MMKSIEKIVRPSEPHFVGDGFRVHNFIPSNALMERTDPFILMDYNPTYHFPPSEIPKGVDVHPHKGFETVTIAYKGRIEHGDSSGGGGIIGEGDVQWMTAGNGVLHKEFHETQWSKNGGAFQMVQLWVNLPAQYKTTPPKYQALQNKDIPKVVIADGKGEVCVIAGEFQGVKGLASTFTPMYVLSIKLKKDAETTINLPQNFNTNMVILEGNLDVNNAPNVPADHFILFRNDGEKITIKANEDAVFLLLSGEPIGETIAAHGPFVMNTRQELVQAWKDFQDGKFGRLE